MPGIEYKIETSADLKAIKSVADSLRQQIIIAQAAGKEYGDLKRQLDSVNRSMSQLGSGKRIGLEMADMVQGLPVIGNFTRALNGMGGPISLAIGGLAALARTAAQAVAEFAGAQTKMAKLDAVLAQNGQLTDTYRNRLQALASTLQATTAIADDQWLDVLSRLTQFGADSSNIDRYAQAVKNLAGITGGDITQAADLFSKAMAGQFEMFGRLGIRIEKTGTQTERLESLMAQLAQKGAGVLEAQSKTLAGQWQQLTNATSDLLEGIGNLIARTGILQGIIALLTGSLTLLQNLFPSLIPRLEGMENRFRTAAQRAEELRAKLRDTGQTTQTVHEAFGESGRALDSLNASLQESTEKAETARKAMLDLAEATARAAKAKVARDLAEGRITPEQAAAANASIENNLQDQKIAAARQAEQEKLDAAKARIAETQAREQAAAQALAEARAKAEALRQSLSQSGIQSDQAQTLASQPQRGSNNATARAAKAAARRELDAGQEDYTKAEAELEKKIAAARAAIPSTRRLRDPQARAEAAAKAASIRQEIAALQAQLAALRELPAALAAVQQAEDERIRAEELAAKTRAEQAPIIASAQTGLTAVSLAETAATDERAAAEAAASKEAAAKTRQQQSAADHQRRMLALQIEINEARQRGDQAAAQRAEALSQWLAEYKRVWDSTQDDALARRAANATLPAADSTAPMANTAATSAMRPMADRLAQIGGFVGGTGNPRQDSAMESTAKNTERTAKALETIARRHTTTLTGVF